MKPMTLSLRVWYPTWSDCLVVNASIDTARDMVLAGDGLANAREAIGTDGVPHALTRPRSGADAVPRVTLPTLPPWSAWLIRGDRGGHPATNNQQQVK
jgi:hypothetical protein